MNFRFNGIDVAAASILAFRGCLWFANLETPGFEGRVETMTWKASSRTTILQLSPPREPPV